MRLPPVALAALVGLGLLLFASPGYAQPAQEKFVLPEGLRHVPFDALGFVHVRTGAFLQTELGRQLLQEITKDREAGRALQKVEGELGMKLADIESITLFFVTSPGGQRFDRWDMPRKVPFAPPFARPAKEMEKFDKKDFDFDKKPFEEKRQNDFEGKKTSTQSFPVVFQEFRDQPGFPGQDFDDFPAGGPMPMSISDPLVIVTSTKDLDRKKILRSRLFPAFGGPGDDHRHGPDSGASVAFLSDRAMLIGLGWNIAHYNDLMARNPGPKTRPLAASLALGVETHMIVAGGALPAEIRRMMARPYGRDAQAVAPIAALFQTDAGLAVDVGQELKVTMQFAARTDASAGHAHQAAKSLRVLGELLLERGNEGGESGGWKLALEKRLKQTLADATIERKDSTVRVQLKMELDPILIKQGIKEIVGTVRQKGDRTQSVNNLKQIGLALHNYHDTYKRLPAAGIDNVRAPDGKPLLSWRVAILPYIEQAPLYQQFDLTQPWDHPTNKKLIARMPTIYMLPGAEAKEGMTHYRVLVGPTTMFELGNRIALTSVFDGTSNTIMAVEANEPTIWTRPDDLPFDPKGPLPKFGLYPEGFNALFGDGTVRYIRSTTPPETLRALITRNGGEAVRLPD